MASTRRAAATPGARPHQQNTTTRPASPSTSSTSSTASTASPPPESEAAPPEALAAMYPRSAGPGSPIVVDVSGSGRHPLLRFQPVARARVVPNAAMAPVDINLAFRSKAECRLVRATLSQHGLREVSAHSRDYNLLWTTSHMKPYTLRELNATQKVNHFPRSSELTRKDRLYVNLCRMRQAKGRRHFAFVPQSFLLPGEFNEFYAEWLKARGEPWIVKPIASSQGRGIYIVTNPRQVRLEDQLVVSRYLDRPLLVDGLKFDLRLYVSVTSYSPLRVYLYKEGLARFATEPYRRTKRELKDSFMHLTNYSINKRSAKYVRGDAGAGESYGSKWSLTGLLRRLKEEGCDTTRLMARIEDLVVKTILAGELPISTACKMFAPTRDSCFELYGFDVLIDEALKPWLLEVNLSPSLATDSPLDLKIKSHLLADHLSLGMCFVADPPTENQRARATLRTQGSASGGAPRPGSRLSREEKRVLRRVEDEFACSTLTGFQRIFPTERSWETYGYFLEDLQGFTATVHRELFPKRFVTKSRLSAPSVARALSLALEEDSSLHQRMMHYMAPLKLRWAPEVAEPRPDETAEEGPAAATARAEDAFHRTKPKSAPEPPVPTIVDGLLRDGRTVSAMQGRQAFAAYLQHIASRLRQESLSGEAVAEEAEAQLDVVLGLLQRAASALAASSAFRVVVPGRRMKLSARLRIVSAQLQEFVDVYNKETTKSLRHGRLLSALQSHVKAERRRAAPGTSEVTDEEFEAFLHLASEQDLEQLLAVLGPLPEQHGARPTAQGRSKPRPPSTTAPRDQASPSRRQQAQPNVFARLSRPKHGAFRDEEEPRPRRATKSAGPRLPRAVAEQRPASGARGRADVQTVERLLDRAMTTKRTGSLPRAW